MSRMLTRSGLGPPPIIKRDPGDENEPRVFVAEPRLDEDRLNSGVPGDSFPATEIEGDCS